MRPVAIFCSAFAGCRHKIHALCEQLYGKNCVDVYRQEGKLCDPEIAGTDREFIWKEPIDCADALSKYQIVHAFGDTCEMFMALLKTGKKFVAHQFDVWTMRGGTDIGEASVHLSDNTVSVFPSPSCRDAVCKRLRIPKNDAYVIKPMPVMAWTPELPKVGPKIPNSIVYAGFVTCDPAAPNGFRYFADVFRKFLDAGIAVYLMCAGEAIFPSVVESYKAPGMTNLHLMIGKPYRDLYKEIAKYSAGFVGYTSPPELPEDAKDYGLASLPNKAFDYMFAGIPTVALGIGDAAPYVRNWGNVTMDPDELVDMYHEAMKMDIDYEHWRRKYCMETQKDMLQEIYGKVAQ